MESYTPPRLLLAALASLIGTVALALDKPVDHSSGDGWLIKVAEDKSAVEVAKSLGAQYAGPLRGVEGYHRIRFLEELQSRPDDPDNRTRIARQLGAASEVLEFEENKVIFRYPKDFVPDDPRFSEQWHLENVGQSGGVPFADINVRPVWDEGLSGKGVTIGVVDEGIQYSHPDLQANWVTNSGYDYNDDDSDPSPSDFEDRHGTAVAGISLAAANGLGGLGVAFEAGFVPLRLIAGGFELGEEAEALSYHASSGIPVDIYNNSWGPSDDFGVRYVDISGVLKSAFASNTESGRGGLGTIYVWAAGNGGLNGDNSNYDGYNASPYTISVAALGDDDIRATYSEPGANLLVAAPSRGRGAGILTTDNTGLSGYDDSDYYDNFSGTSAATPIVSGVVALMLEKRPDLNWRDVQKILALTSVPVDFINGGWNLNGAGHWVSHNYGFGRVDATAAVRLAGEWVSLGSPQVAEGFSGAAAGLPEYFTVSRGIQINRNIRVQHARVTVNLDHSDWGDLRIELVSPDGTRSTLSEPHSNANSSGAPFSWSYLSTHYLNESSSGQWFLEVTDAGFSGTGSLQGWTLELWGTDFNASENQPPVVVDQFIQSTEFPVAIDLLQDVSDPDGDPLEIISFQQPGFGSIEKISDRRIRFTQGNSPTGTDVFSVLISDGRGAVTRRIIQVLDPRPVGRNDFFPVLAGRATDLPVLDNDLDPDSDPLRLIGVSPPARGTASINGDGSLSYTPAAGFTGVERIQYELTDDSDGDSTGWATVIVQDKADVALDFDGEDDFLRVDAAPDLAMRDKFTVEAWIYPEDWGEYVTGFGRILDRSSFILFLNGFDHAYYNDKSLVCYFALEDGTTVAANSPANAIRLKEWQHVAVSYDSSNSSFPVRMYVNGSQVGHGYPLPDTGAPRLPISDNRNIPLYLGESPSGARAFKGSMAEFRVWDSVLTLIQVSSRYAVRLSGLEAGLQLYFPLDRTLDPVAISGGGLPLLGTISGAQRVPRVIPWRGLENSYTVISDAGNGWWEDRTLGWLYGDRYPWVFLPAFDWVYTGHDSSDNPYFLYSNLSELGWLSTTASLYPWFYQYGSANWIRYLEGTTSPSWFYSFSSPGWFSLDVPPAGL